jgi:DNA-binding response OmpR family regulator
MKGRILVVDTDAAGADPMRHRLAREGYEVAVVPDEDEAVIAAVQRARPDLILLEPGPPEAGLHALERLKGDVDTVHVPVFVWTGRCGDAARPHAFRGGARGYFEKTADPERLVSAIDRLMRPRP